MMKSLILLTFLCLPLVTQAADCPKGSTVKTMKLTAGTRDDYREPWEETVIRDEVKRLYESWQFFDDTKNQGPRGATFSDLPCHILDATLVLHLYPFGREYREDTISIGFDGKDWLFREQLGNIGELTGEPTVIEINLTQLGILEQLRETGFIDFMVGFNTALDYAELNITYCEFTDCNNNCVPDSEDIAKGTSKDTNKNGIPDECEEPINQGEIVCPPTVILIDRDDCCEETTLIATVKNVEGDYQLTNSIDPQQGGRLTHCFPVGATTVYFTLTTYDGYTVTCTTTVIVQDKKGPSITPRLP